MLLLIGCDQWEFDANWCMLMKWYHWCIWPSNWQPRQQPQQKLMQRQLRMLYLPCYERHVLKHLLVMFWHELEPCCLNSLPWQGHLQCSGLHFLKILWKLPKSATQLKSKQCWTVAIAGRCSPSWSGCKGNCECCLGHVVNHALGWTLFFKLLALIECT